MINKDGLETKLNFLQNEVKFLKEENNELRELLKLNKEVIRIQKEFTFNSGSLTSSNTRRPDTEIARSEINSERGFHNIFTQLYEENHQLYKLTEQLGKQRDEARSQALIFEQIFEDATQKNIEIQMDRQNQLIQLQKKVEEKDKIIQDLQSQLQEVQSRKKFKQRIVIRPAEEILLVYNQIEQMRLLIGRMIKENKILTNEKKQLQLLINLMNSNQKQENTSIEQSPNKSYNEDDMPKLQNQEKTQGGEEDLSFVDFLPSKVQTNTQNTKSMAIPKLDLTKAQKIQKLNIQKQEEIDEKEEIELKTLKMQQQAKLNQKIQTPSAASTLNMFTSPNKLCIQLSQLTDQNKALQKELSLCRQKLQDEILLTKTLEDEVDEMERQLNDTRAANELLIQSQQKYEQKWQKINAHYHQYQEFYKLNHDERYETPRLVEQQISLRNLQLNSPSHKIINYSSQIREIAYQLYNKHKIEEKLEQIELYKQVEKSRSFTN